MARPTGRLPIGLRLTRTSHVVSQAFERAMADAGGSASAWQVLLIVRSREWGNQASMAAAMGITGATLTHHLNALEVQGLVRRWRDPSNRRVQQVELTDEGKTLFDRLREAAVEHDKRLRSKLTDGETELLSDLLDRLRAGLDDQVPSGSPGAS